MFGSPPTGNGEPEQGRGSWKVNDGVESGCRMAWRTHEEAEAAGPGCFRSAHRRKNKVQKGMRPPGLLTLSAASLHQTTISRPLQIRKKSQLLVTYTYHGNGTLYSPTV